MPELFAARAAEIREGERRIVCCASLHVGRIDAW